MNRDNSIAVSLDRVLVELFALGFRNARPTVIGDTTTFFGGMMGCVVNGILTVHDWECIEFGLRSVKEGRVHVCENLGSGVGSLYDKLRSEFPLFRGSPPPGHPYPGAFHDPPVARQAPKTRKGKKGRGRR